VQAEYQDKLFVIMQDYLYSSDPITAYRNEFNRTINDGFTFAFLAGWADAGASALTDEAQGALNGLIDAEIQFADSLFTQLKTLRDDDEIPMDDKMDAAHAHAEGYAQSLANPYSVGEMMAQPEIDLTFDGEDGSSDSVCQKNNGRCVQLKGETHPASWWIDNDLVPARGNDNYDCGCWNCKHQLVDKKGKVWASADGSGL
jgi:hypothetical protein